MIGAALLPALVGVVAWVGVRRERDTAGWVLHTEQVLASAQRLLAAVTDAETGQRGYLLTGEPAYLAPYDAGRAAAAAELARLRTLTRDNAAQQRRIAAADSLVTAKLGELAETVARRRRDDAAGALALVRTDAGRRTMVALRGAVGAVAADEARLLDRRRRADAEARRAAGWLLALGVAAAGLLAAGLHALLLRYARARDAAANRAAERARRLEAQGAELEAANRLLQDQAAELELSNQQLQELAGELEAQAEELQTTAVHLEEQTEAADDARRAAEAAEARLRTAFTQAPAIVTVTEGPDHRFVLANARALAAGARPDLVGLTYAGAYPDLAAQGYAALLDRVYATGEPYVAQEARVPVPQPGGGVEELYLDFVYQPLRDADGRVTGILHHAVDVTAQVRARQALAAGEAKYRALFDTMAEGFCLVEVLLDAEGRPSDYRILEANPAFAGQTGLADAVGRTAREVVPGVEPHWVDAYGRVALTGEPVHFEQGSDAMGRWFDVSAFRVGAAEDRRVAILFMDVTAARASARERERLLQALEVERSRLAAVFAAAPSVLAVVRGPQHIFELANEAYLRLIGRRDVVGRPLLDAVPELRGQGFDALLDRVMATGTPYVGREVPTGVAPAPGAAVEERYFDFVYLPLEEPDGAGGRRVVGVIAHGTDVTDQVRARREVERLLAETEAARGAAEAANAAKSQFLATMSHELRTPLNAIQGYVQLLDMGLHGPVTGDQRGALARVQRAQGRLLTLINDVLNYAKLEGGRVEYDVRAVDVRDVVADVTPLVEPQLTAKGLVLDVRLPDAPCVVWADREKLGQVLANLLSNAAKFTEPVHPRTGAPGRVGVRVAMRAEGGSDGRDDGRPDLVLLQVSDTGRGVPRDKQDAIFEPFVQVRTSGSVYAHATEGAGLGLAISRDLARGMGGDLTVESGEGTGSTFSVTLRRVVDAAGQPTDRRTHDERRETDERRRDEDRRHHVADAERTGAGG